MTSHPTTTDPAGRFPPDVIAWRRERLRFAGCPPRQAHALAAGPCDLHALVDLIERGCPPELAARIAAPLDEGPGA